MPADVIIVGAGLTGLCCAKQLHQANVPFVLVDAADAVGGRMRTDQVDGFLLDRGFQVFLTSYPEAQRVLDYEALDLQPFLPGAAVWYDERFHELTDPWRRPWAALRSVLSPIGTFGDKLRVGRFRAACLKGTLDDQFQVPEITTLQDLQEFGFSASMIDRFFKPFLGGVFLDPALRTSNRMLRFVFRMFAAGTACLPAKGMEAIPRQIAATLPAERIRLGTRVVNIQPGAVTFADGQQLEARDIIVAVEGCAASQLLSDNFAPEGAGVTCCYFAAKRAPIEKPILLLNGSGEGSLNNLCVPTSVAPSYGPADQSLISTTVLGVATDEEALLEELRRELSQWFGPDVNGWRHLRTYRIPYALPQQAPPTLSEPQRPVRWQPHIYVCGDHRDTASIQGAMVSGRRAAEALLDDRR